MIPPYIFSFFLICSKDTDENFSRIACPLLFSSLLSFFLSNSLRSGKWITKNRFFVLLFLIPPFLAKEKKTGDREKVQKNTAWLLFLILVCLFLLLLFSSALSVWIWNLGKTFYCDGFKFDIFMFPMSLLPLSAFSILLLFFSGYPLPLMACCLLRPF